MIIGVGPLITLLNTLVAIGRAWLLLSIAGVAIPVGREIIGREIASGLAILPVGRGVLGTPSGIAARLVLTSVVLSTL